MGHDLEVEVLILTIFDTILGPLLGGNLATRSMVPGVHILKPDLQDHQLYGAEEVSIPSGGGQDLSRGGPEMVHFEVQDHDLTGVCPG